MNSTQTTDVIADRIKQYQAQLKEWDAKLDQMDAGARIEYEQERDAFSSDLAEAWRDLTEAKLEEYMARIEGSYQNLKARWDGYFNENDEKAHNS